MSFAAAEQIADAVLYEGYALYPYRASSTKNRVRWQFGVVAPREYAERTESDPWFAQTECLIETAGASLASIAVRVRGLQLQARTIEMQSPDGDWNRVASARVGERDIVEWDEGVERTADARQLPVDALLGQPIEQAIDFPASRDVEFQVDPAGRPIRIVRESAAVSLRSRVEARLTSGIVTLRVRVENVTPTDADSRETALRQALVGAHTLLAIEGGRFLSLLDPPAEAKSAAAACMNRHTWPVLVGDAGRQDLMLSSPIILYDYPAIAPESPGNLFDGTEIDEILTLRILTLTDSEKAEARATDTRAREVIDRADQMPAEALALLHGTMRGVPDSGSALADVNESSNETASDDRAWRMLLNPETDAPPETASVEVMGVTIAKGSRVVLRPTRRADSIDMFLAGRVARVEGVYRDIEGQAYVAVVLDDDPARDFRAEMGRFFYYGIEEIEPAGVSPAAGKESGV